MAKFPQENGTAVFDFLMSGVDEEVKKLQQRKPSKRLSSARTTSRSKPSLRSPNRASG